MREIVNQKTATITSIDGKYSHTFDNTNELLGQIPGIIGIKTGWTDNSGECLVTYVEGDRDLIVVVLNSSNRFADTKTLINWSSDL
jgi:serine-type D-Ala-D-Ala carboxypeptidase (penicillin-binding protein 5/6)